MKRPAWIYVGLILVFVAAAGTASLFPVESVMRYIAGTPAIAALVAALFQLVRDEAAFERQQMFYQRQEAFGLGATSHMAIVAFDKHVEFCEKYMSEVHGTVTILFRVGPMKETLPHVRRFVELRREYAAWLPREIESGLEPFENALNRIGALSSLVQDLGSSDQEARGNAIKAAFKIFEEMMNIDGKLPTDHLPEFAVDKVKDHIRAVLGINELTTLRRKLIGKALHAVSGDG